MSFRRRPSRPLGTLLVVEDDVDGREILALTLEHAGYTVETASDGLQAIGRLKLDPAPDVVITDLSMPTMNGWELIATMQATPGLAAIPVIVISAVSDVAPPPSRETCFLVRKPIDLDKLLRTVAGLCNHALRPPGPGE